MKLNFKLLLLLITLAVTLPASAQFNLKKAISGGAKAVKALTLTDALKDGISSAGGVAAALSDSQLGTLTQSLINAKYSQKQENEADDCGYDFLVSKGKNPWGMVMAFEKLQTMEGNRKSSYITKMFSSHPETKARIEKMTKRCVKDNYPRPAK